MKINGQMSPGLIQTSVIIRVAGRLREVCEIVGGGYE